jgi:methionine biosynthesis protein MetW
MIIRKPDFKSIAALDYNAYWTTRGFHLNATLKEREEIILAHIPSTASVLDIGCGNSLLPVALRDKGCTVTVADISSIVLEGYRAVGISSFEIDLEQLREKPITGIYDYIILSEVLEHTKNPEEIIQILRKHTKRFVLTVPNSAFYRYRIQLFFGGRFLIQWVSHPGEHLRFWSHTDFIDWLAAMGLTLEYTTASNGFSFFRLLPGLKNVWKNLFGHQMVYIAICP